ncbi:MAG: glycosyltransferase family 4 protein [Gordonia sp. (in: high G+C Gram-positive bacteria)]
MRVLLVSWEYPPVVVGGLGRHVGHLAVDLAAAGHDVVVLSRQPSGSDALTHPTTDRVDEASGNVGASTVPGGSAVRVIAVAEDPPEFAFGTDMMAWALALGHGLLRAGLTMLTRDGWTPEVVHAHDWIVAHAAVALAEIFDVPLVSTIHATEAGRHSGWVSGRINRQVHSVEWWLANDSDAVITCSESMRDEVRRLFDPPGEITVIHNGIDVDRWPFAPRRPAAGPPELLFAGRLEYEKGVQDLIAALPRIRRTHPGTTVTVAGDGTQLDWLVEQTRRHRVSRSVEFLGAVDHAGLVELMHRCAAIVLPSRYEPFGIVALEAAATGIPLVTSTAGGLGEAVVDGSTGLTFAPADVAGLAAAVRGTLSHPAEAAARARRARARLSTDFAWSDVAARTATVYAGAKRRVRVPIGRPEIPLRPLPERDPNSPVD